MPKTWVPWPDLKAMLDRARREGLWFWCRYQDLWFSPDEIESQWNNGRFRWGAMNWKLRPPSEYRAQLASAGEAARRDLLRLDERIKQSGG